ncbi:type II toxin-antitoxin system Phd/YefM family antitoxin [Psychromonas sp. KJ10-10]|uniref:type II toxin-antitoxin system Phd/YefM family antitoxin n=1 Tax=Psychromonas sp. KJ10-10 TaxID=3391823 RepID=UPI0039B37182
MKVELETILKRQAMKILSEFHSSKEPVLITEHGQPSAYLVDFEHFEFMQKRMQIFEAFAKGEQAISCGETKSNIEAKKDMNKWLK